MKMKSLSLILVIFIVACGCGCKAQPENLSSNVEIIEIEELVFDENRNEITSSRDTAASTDDASSDIQDTFVDNGNTVSNKDTGSSQTVNIDYDMVVEIDICGDIVRGYLDANDATNQYYWLSTYGGSVYAYQNITLNWEMGGAPYTVYMSENRDFSNATILVTNSYEVKNAVCIPGKTYYWKVVGSNSNKILGGGCIKIKDAPVRWIYIDGVSNVRDMGGWNTTDGKAVKYGMLYRGAQLNKSENGTIVNAVTDDGIKTLNLLGIKTEFDLRRSNDVQTAPAGTSLNHISIAEHTSYNNIFSKSNKDTVVENYKTIFEYLSDENNYPIYTHCQGGADRTGTYAFLLNGLLGVSYEDLTRDFELTSFASVKRWRGEGKGNTFMENDTSYKTETGQTIAWGDLYNGMMDYGLQNGCTTLQASIEHWFVNYIGISQSKIDSFKNIMLE